MNSEIKQTTNKRLPDEKHIMDAKKIKKDNFTKDIEEFIASGNCIKKDFLKNLNENLKKAHDKNILIEKYMIQNIDIVNNNVNKYNTDIESWTALLSVIPKKYEKQAVKGCIVYYLVDKTDNIPDSYKKLITKYKELYGQ